jgi:hypothetical protein
MIYWLFKLKKKGWLMLLIYFAFNTVTSIYGLLFYEPPQFFIDLQPDRTVHVFGIVISGLVFYYFNRKDVLDTLQVSRKFQQNVIFFFIIPIAVIWLILAITDIDLSYYFS